MCEQIVEVENVLLDSKGIDNKEHEDKEVKLEEFAYLDRGGFSTEIFKIELRGLPKFYGIGELKKFMSTKLCLRPTKIKSPQQGSSWVYIGFQNDEEKMKAIQILDGYQWKGRTLSARVALPAPDPLVKKRQREEEQGQNKKLKTEEDITQDERLRKSLTPYWDIPYEEQVKIKTAEMRNVLLKFGNELWKSNPSLRSTFEELRKTNDGLICAYKGVQTTKTLEGYRNKCEFTIGIDAETKLPTVGYRLGSYVTGVTGVAPADNLLNTSEVMKKATKIFQEFIRQSELPVYSVENYSGYWRQLTIRQSKSTKELMLIVAIHPQSLSTDQLTELKKKLVNHFSTEEAKECCISSLYFTHMVKRTTGEDKQTPELLFGQEYITDCILGMNFQISPDAFFQVNTEGAELLYKSALEMTKPTHDTTVLDICCGTGTIGLCFAKSCKQVLGIEMNADAIRDAKVNSELNQVTNCDWFTGKAEDILPAVLARVTTDQVLAVIDPPRAGLHMRGVTQLRAARKVQRVIYACCDPHAALKSLTALGRPASKTLKGSPFIPKAAVAVDMFPHTKHVELLLLLERAKDKITDQVTTDQEGVSIIANIATIKEENIEQSKNIVTEKCAITTEEKQAS